MATAAKLQADQDELKTLQQTVEALEEIAANRMRRVRSSIVAYRDFVQGLSAIFHDIKIAYKRQILLLQAQKKGTDTRSASLLAHNGKTVAVMLSANTGLYGDIISQTFTLFGAYIKSHQCDVVIIGRLGRLFFQRAFPDRPYQYIEMDDYPISQERLKYLSRLLLAYKNILVFHGKFVTLDKQVPNMLDMYAIDIDSQTAGTTKIDYLSEPSLEEIVTFFESEIFSSIVEQTLHESGLAKLASRLYSLDRSTDKLKKEVKKTNLRRYINIHRLQNQKQLSTLSSISLWNKK